MTPFPQKDRPAVTGSRDPSPSELGDPARFLDELDRLLPLRDGITVALVEESATTQRVVRAARLEGELDPSGGSADSETMYDLAHALCAGIDPLFPIRYSFATVVTRPGRCVLTAPDLLVVSAWWYANDCLSVFHGDLVLLTPSGWLTWLGGQAGCHPKRR